MVAHTNVVEKGKLYNDPVTGQALRYEKAASQLIRNNSILDAAVPIWANDDDFILSSEKGGKTRIGTVRMGLPLQQALAARNRILASITLILLASGGLMGLAALLVLGRVLWPVRLLAESAGRIGRGQAGVLVTTKLLLRSRV